MANMHTELSAPDNTEALPTRFVWVWMSVLILSFVYLCVHGMNAHYYNADELTDIYIAKGRSIKEVLQFSHFETHPPFGQILRHYWMMISEDMWFVRSLALVFGVLMIPLYYRIGTLLQGREAGLCLAALIGFSHGWIIQSFIVRNYTIFGFFLSLAFLFYLQWLQNRSAKNLCGYAVAGLLACLSHFSGIFSMFAFAIGGLIMLYRRKAKTADWVIWLVVNGAVGLIALSFMYMWRDASAALNFAAFYMAYGHSAPALHGAMIYQSAHPFFTEWDLLLTALFYPLIVSYYMLPTQWAVMLAGLMPVAVVHNKKLRPLLLVCGVAMLLGMVLMGSGVYNALASRRSIWILPFIVVPLGVAMAEACVMAAQYLSRRWPLPWLRLMMVLLLVLGWAIYANPSYRFSEPDTVNDFKEYKYAPTKASLDALVEYIKALSPSSLIVVPRNYVFYLAPYSGQNPYSYFPATALQAGTMVDMPYFGKHVLFASTYYMTYDGIDELLSDRAKPLLEGADTILLMQSSWHSLTKSVVFCSALPKQIVTFPPLAPGHMLTADEIQDIPLLLVVVSKKDYMDQLISPMGKAHDCLGHLDAP